MIRYYCLYFSTHYILFQEWPEEDYPPYANGPGYIVSSDIAQFVVTEFEKHTLRVSLINFCYSLYSFQIGKVSAVLIFNHNAAVQDGRCEHGNVGGAVQQLKTRRVSSQLEILPVWLHRRLLHSTLSVPKTDDLHVEQAADGKA